LTYGSTWFNQPVGISEGSASHDDRSARTAPNRCEQERSQRYSQADAVEEATGD
jgi:hypothetical protein